MIFAAKADTATAAAGAVAVAATAPLIGDYAVMLLASLLGGLVSLSGAPAHASRWDGAKYLFRAVAIGFSFAWIAAITVANSTGHEVVNVLWPVAFFLAWSGERLAALRNLVIKKMATWIGDR